MSSLEDLEGDNWGEPATGPTRLVETALRLRRKPVVNLTTEDLRLLLLQQIGLVHLVPIALEKLALNPLAEGDFYPGDLLRAVARVDDAFWHAHPALATQLRAVVASLPDRPEVLIPDWPAFS